MISNLDPSAEIFLADLGRAQARVERAQRQLSSGKRIQSASDAPDEIDALLQLRATLERNAQIQSNLARARTAADTAEQTLSSSMKMMDRALTVAAQALAPAATAESRRAIADDVQSLSEQIVAFTRTTVEGRYIFSGDLDQEATYDTDWTTPTGVTQLVAATATRRVEDPAGGSFAAGRTAAQIFDSRNPDGTPAADNVFYALASLRTALLDNDETAIGAAQALVRQAGAYLNSQLAFYGHVQNRIQDASDFAAGYDTRIRAELGQKEDADIAAAALEVTQGNTQVQAALAARSKLPRTSLFDFIG